MNALTPYLTRSVRPQGQAFRRRLGFSAIEVTAVAAIIAVLALILVPVVNKRVDESKIVAAQDDMVAIQKAEEIAFGYTGHYYRLCDLDRPTPESATDPLGDRKIPRGWWNRPIVLTEKVALRATWSGPYMQLRRSITMEEMVQNFPNLVHVYDNMPGGGAGAVGGGPIMVFENENDWANPTPPPGTWPDLGDAAVHTRRRYPVDPWGNPYLFFGPGKINPDDAAQTALKDAGKTPYNWPTAVIYSLGPDGLPGMVASAAITDGYYYFREAETGTPSVPPVPPLSNLGTGDDLKREF